jgi:hypothetical protein
MPSGGCSWASAWWYGVRPPSCGPPVCHPRHRGWGVGMEQMRGCHWGATSYGQPVQLPHVLLRSRRRTGGLSQSQVGVERGGRSFGQLQCSPWVWDPLLGDSLAHDYQGPPHCKGTSGHFLTSPLISHFPLSICIPHPHLCTISKDYTYGRRLSGLTVRRLSRSRLTNNRRLPDSHSARTLAASDEPRTHWDRSA